MFYIAFNAITIVLQYKQIFGGIYSNEYIPDVRGRLAGLTEGSWELPALLAMLVSASIMDDYYRKKKILLISIVIISALMVYMSGTRTGMIVYAIGIVFTIIAKYKTNITMILTVCITGALFLNQGRMNELITNKYQSFDYSDYPYSLQIRLNELPRLSK